MHGGSHGNESYARTTTVFRTQGADWSNGAMNISCNCLWFLISGSWFFSLKRVFLLNIVSAFLSNLLSIEGKDQMKSLSHIKRFKIDQQFRSLKGNSLTW